MNAGASDILNTLYDNSIAFISDMQNLIDFLSSVINVDKYEDAVYQIKKKKATDVIDFYANVFEQIAAIESLLTELNQAHIEYYTSTTDTFRMTYKTMCDKVVARFAAFKNDADQLNHSQLIEKLSDDAWHAASQHKQPTKPQSPKHSPKPQSHIIQQITALREKYRRHPILIHLYASIMQLFIDKCFTVDKSVSFELLRIILEDKTAALSSSYTPLFKKTTGNNPPQSRFGLLPATTSMPLNKLLVCILAGEKITVSNTNLAQIAKSNSICIVEIRSIVYTPVEYNVSPLVSAEIAADYMQPKEYGITTKTIERFKTIIIHTANKWDFSITIHGNADLDKFYIIETLDGTNYRGMVPWLSSGYIVPKFKIQPLLNYSLKPSGALEYHSRATKIAVNNMFLGKALALEEFDTRLADVNSGKMQNGIMQAVLDQARALIAKYRKIDNQSICSDVLHDPSIVNVFISATEREFALDEQSFNGGKFPTAEMVSSFIVALQTASRRFAREIHNGYSRKPLTAADFTGDTQTDIATATKKIEDVIQTAIDLIIKLDDNLFTSNYYKYLILNYTGK